MLYFLFPVCLLVLLGAPHTSSAEPLVGHLTLAGPSTVEPVDEKLGQEFEKCHSAVRIDVYGGGSAVGIVTPQTSLADMGMVSRALQDKETRRLHSTPFTRDRITLFTHASNPVSDPSRRHGDEQ